VLVDAIRGTSYPQHSSDAMEVDGEQTSPNPLLDGESPVLAIVDRMREARMSMVANAGQYKFTYRTILEGLAMAMTCRGRQT
jgi:protein tyrosine phosphatase